VRTGVGSKALRRQNNVRIRNDGVACSSHAGGTTSQNSRNRVTTRFSRIFVPDANGPDGISGILEGRGYLVVTLPLR